MLKKCQKHTNTQTHIHIHIYPSVYNYLSNVAYHFLLFKSVCTFCLNMSITLTLSTLNYKLLVSLKKFIKRFTFLCVLEPFVVISSFFAILFKNLLNFIDDKGRDSPTLTSSSSESATFFFFTSASKAMLFSFFSDEMYKRVNYTVMCECVNIFACGFNKRPVR